MKVGVFGGTFDPIHVGHLIVAEEARGQFVLDEVLFVLAGQAGLRSRDGVTDDRPRMAVAGRARGSSRARYSSGRTPSGRLSARRSRRLPVDNGECGWRSGSTPPVPVTRDPAWPYSRLWTHKD